MSAAHADPAPAPASAFPEIGDYAAIGDCRSCALVSRAGSIEWLCLPEYSSPSLFGALLDRRAGHFAVSLAQVQRVSRCYAGDSNVLITRFEHDGGVLELSDAMILPDPRGHLQPQGELLRRLACVRGEIDATIEIVPRPDYAKRSAHFVRRGALGWQCQGCGFGAWLLTDVHLQPSDGGSVLNGHVHLRAGETRWLSLVHDQCEPCALLPLGNAAEQRLQRTINWWQGWASRCQYHGAYAAAVRRSLLAIKLLTSSLSGAILAAATSSLPEHVSARRNWDYRYCWVRDSAFALPSFLALGYRQEAARFLNWLLHNTRLSWPKLRVMYDMYGRDDIKERNLDHLAGYRGTRPVRVGNAAQGQLQLDIYGELLQGVKAFVDAGGELDRDERRMLRGLGRNLLAHWRDPDQGIWEMRGEPRHHTYSKIMCWSAFTSLAGIGARFDLGLDGAALARTAEEVRHEVDAHALDPSGAYLGRYGGGTDASLLLLPRSGFLPPGDPRLLKTYERMSGALARDGLWMRYLGDDGVGGEDNPFAPCSFWDVEYLSRSGDRKAAHASFERLLGRANDVGLYAEEFHPGGGFRGNFPQALTHVSLLRAAMALEDAHA